MDRNSYFPRGAADEPISPPRHQRGSASPSRLQKITALSPLQALSPLIPTPAHPRTASETSSVGTGTRSRAGSITKSLSRRQSLIAHAARWGTGDEEEDENYMPGPGLFSKLTLVKAPSEGSGLKRRSKSSSALAPFSTMAAQGDSPATANRGPRRSFAASSFAGMTPMAPVRSPAVPYTPGGPDAVHRITQLYGSDNDVGMQRKTLTPEEVVEVARGLSSPVAVPEGGFKGSDLKRRKSSGYSHRRNRSSGAIEPDSPEKPPIALEPVDYVQLDDDTLLPFVDRPAEVKELLHYPSNEKMFKALRAAFPKTPARDDWQRSKPEEWSWDEFCKHLTVVTRAESPDYAWVFLARQAVRQRSVALWEKVGVCLGCDGDLLNAGGEDDIPLSWGGLGLGEEGEYDPSDNQVYIAGLEAMDPAETERLENELLEEFGEIVEDDGSAAALAGMETIGESAEEHSRSRQNSDQKPAITGLGINGKPDPLGQRQGEGQGQGQDQGRGQGQGQYGDLGRQGQTRPSRSRSFVGLQILTSPTLQHSNRDSLPRSPSITQTPALGGSLPIFERGPGSALFPSSFSSLSVEPNLGRGASVGLAGSGGMGVGMRISSVPVKVPDYGEREERRRWSGLARKPSGAGLSESAITFATTTSESEWSLGAGGEHPQEIHA